MPLRTLQIALIGGNNDAVAVGIKNFPTHKLALISLPKDRQAAEDLKANLERVLRIPIDVYVAETPGVKTMLQIVSDIVTKEKREYQDFIINVGGAEKYFTCAGTTAAFVYGMKAFDVMGDTPEMLPILKLSYSEIISEAKIGILRSIDKVGGVVESLEALSSVSGYGKPLLSYHVNGGEDSRGLIELGLVEAEKGSRGKLIVKLTTLGKTLLLTKA